MLQTLYMAEKALPQLLQDREGWQSLLVDYHKPFVERVWRPWLGGDYRISLHRIHPCEPAESLFHPHPCPSAIRLLNGSYEMSVGFGKGTEPPPVALTEVIRAPDAYEMVHPDGWHSVRPLDGPSYSLMVTAKPWPERTGGPKYDLKPLGEETIVQLLDYFQMHYSPEEWKDKWRKRLDMPGDDRVHGLE